MNEGPGTSRAARSLAEAPVSPCPHCGRTTKTVQGVCADCWGVKDPDVALDLRPAPKTEPLFDVGTDLDDLFGVAPWIVVAGVVVLAALVAVVLRAVL